MMANFTTLKMNSNEIIKRIPEFIKSDNTEIIFINGTGFPAAETEFTEKYYGHSGSVSLEIKYHAAIHYLSDKADDLYRVSIWDTSIHISKE